MPDDEVRPEQRLVLSDSHRRHLAVSLRHTAELLEEAGRILTASRSESPFRKYTSDLAPWQAGVIADHVASILRKLVEAGREIGLDLAGHALDARHALHVHVAFAAIDVEEMHARYVRGYGALDPNTARRLDALADALENAIRELERALFVPPGESIEARIARLARSPVSPEILQTLDGLITKYHIAELRRPMAMLIERIEQRTFNIALFGRVSSGKSSLLNALLGQPILPVGVTPITAVPTRIRFGEGPSVRIVYGDGRDETVAVERLAELASETENPGNRRRVALLQVRYPSPLLREGVEFVDTPGIGSLATQGSEETFAYLPRADLAILLVDVGSAIGADELSVLRLLQSAAIPVQVVISKADLADPPSLERMQSYVRDTIAGQTGLTPLVHPVSAIASGAPFLRRWMETSIQPLLDSHESMLEESIRRTTGAIRDAITMRLDALQNGRPTRSTAALEEKARDLALELRQTIKAVPVTIESTIPDVLRTAAWKLFDQRQGPWDARVAVAAIAQQAVDAVRVDLLERQRRTKESFRELAREGGLAPELLQLAESAEELEQLPMLDVAAALPRIDVGRPLLAAVAPNAAKTRLTKRLRSQFGAPLSETFRRFGNRLHDWAIGSLDRLQASFASAIGATRSDAAGVDVDPRSVEDDLHTLASLAMASDTQNSSTKEHP